MWTVWENPRLDETRHERALFVRDGFSWGAFLIAPLWLLAHGMWLVLIAYLAIGTALSLGAEAFIGEAAATIIGVGAAVWFAFEARAIRRWTLARRGYEMMAVVEGRTIADAERRYYGAAASEPAQFVAPSYASASPYARTDVGVIGVFPEGPR